MGASNQIVKTDRKSTRLNSSHLVISYAVFCLKKPTSWVQPILAAAGVLRLCEPDLLPCRALNGPSSVVAAIGLATGPCVWLHCFFFFFTWPAPLHPLPSPPTPPSPA